uniref:Uncharacterized protein n=1 Tax=Arion vulgaris TaxID=1028688 RepID=A0A0B6YWF3_9EUPU
MGTELSFHDAQPKPPELGGGIEGCQDKEGTGSNSHKAEGLIVRRGHGNGPEIPHCNKRS